MAADTCLVCKAPLERPDVGRPPTYCSPVCRRAAEYELRRLQRRIERLEHWAERVRAHAWDGDGNQEAKRIDRQVAKAQTRLLALLSGHPDPERVSPP